MTCRPARLAVVLYICCLLYAGSCRLLCSRHLLVIVCWVMLAWLFYRACFLHPALMGMLLQFMQFGLLPFILLSALYCAFSPGPLVPAHPPTRLPTHHTCPLTPPHPL